MITAAAAQQGPLVHGAAAVIVLVILGIVGAYFTLTCVAAILMDREPARPKKADPHELPRPDGISRK